MGPNRGIYTFVIIGFISIFFLPCNSFAGKWWEAKQVNSAIDTIIVNHDKVGENKVINTAIRKNWEKG